MNELNIVLSNFTRQYFRNPASSYQIHQKVENDWKIGYKKDCRPSVDGIRRHHHVRITVETNESNLELRRVIISYSFNTIDKIFKSESWNLNHGYS